MTTLSVETATLPSDRLAEMFAAHVARWATALGCDHRTVEAAQRAAEEVSRATGEGHVCIPLQDAAGAPITAARLDSLRKRLLDSQLVGTPEDPSARPLILDAADRLYLHRYYDYEVRLARRLAAAAAAPGMPVGRAARARLKKLFAAAADGDGVDWQQVGVALALSRRLTVISGGPGTGKTTAVVNVLACLLAEDPGCRIALAAPTGKAAARMTEAIRMRAEHLPDDVRASLPDEASTIHRLIGAVPAPGRPRYHAGNQLAIDALVVDEASMLDLALAVQLLEAVPDSARVVLLGDKDQLAAVESGAVFAEISADPTLSRECRDNLADLCGVDAAAITPDAAVQASALRDSVVWFNRNFRFAADSGIGRLAASINAASAEETLAWLQSGGDAAVRWIEDEGDDIAAETWQSICDGYSAYADAVREYAGDPAAVERAFAAFRVLCALREGRRGAAGLNQRLERHLQALLAPAGDRPVRSPWYPGRPVIILRNDYVIKLFNGDIGIALPGANGELAVHFPTGSGGYRPVAPARLPVHQSAFAMTVHKSQGSEFDHVAVILPPQSSRVVTRELLYTAVTRARRSVTLCTGTAALRAGIEASTQRNSGLLSRLAERAT